MQHNSERQTHQRIRNLLKIPNKPRAITHPISDSSNTAVRPAIAFAGFECLVQHNQSKCIEHALHIQHPTLRVHNIVDFGIFAILDVLFAETEYIAQSNNTNAEHDPFQTAAKI